MKKAITLTALTVTSFALPIVSLAASSINTIDDVGQFIIGTINGVLVPVLFAVAFIVFLWGAFTTFILGAGAADVQTKGKSLMLYGLIGFFVMVSIWGLVKIMTGSVNLDNTGPDTPTAGVEIR